MDELSEMARPVRVAGIMPIESAAPVARREKILVRDARGRVVERRRPTHALAATDRMFVAALREDEQCVFQRLRAELRREFRPEGASDAILVEQTALLFFRYLRASELDYRIGKRATFLHYDGTIAVWDGEIVNLERMGRYQAQIERALRLCLEKLLAKKQAQEAARQGERSESSGGGGSAFGLPPSLLSLSRRERISS